MQPLTIHSTSRQLTTQHTRKQYSIIMTIQEDKLIT